jgi:hypothetical protein
MNALPLGSGTSKKRTRLLGALLGAGLVAAGLAVWAFFSAGTATHPAAAPAKPAPAAAKPAPQPVVAVIPPKVTEQQLEALKGVRILHVAVSGDGGLVDVRYQILDPDKANALHAANTPPELVDETTGVVVDNLFMGHTHKTTDRPGQTEFFLFENPGNLVQTGSKVSVELGGVRVAHVPVE